MSVFQFQPGHYLTFTSDEDKSDILLSSIMRTRDDDRILGLLACKETSRFNGYHLQRTKRGSIKKIGTIDSIRECFEHSGYLDQLFGVVKFDEITAGEIRKEFKVAVLSKDFRVNAFKSNGMHVRRMRGQSVEEIRQIKKNSHRRKLIYRGIVSGDVTNADIRVRDNTTVIKYGGLIEGRSPDSFAATGDGGKAVLSSTKALLGFVVGKSEKKTLMLTAEDISNELNVDFLAPDSDLLPASDDIQIRTRA